MKVLVIHNILWAHYKSVLFQEIQKNFSEQHEFHVLQIAKNELARKNMEAEQVAYRYNYTLLFDEYIENIPKIKEIYEVIKFILKYKPDVINVSGYGANISTIPVVFLFKLLGKKIILSNESTLADASTGGLKGWVKKLIVKLCDGYVVFGNSSEKLMLNLGATEDKLWIKNAAVVDNKSIREVYERAKTQNNFPEIKTKNNFIFAGRISAEKNVLLLIKAFQNIMPDDWGLIIVGNGNQEDALKKQIALKPQNIYKYDAVPWDVVPKFFAKSDSLVLPSSSEPWGLVVNEAMICGLAVITSEAVGCTENLVKNNGFVVKTNSLSDLESAMIQIIQSDNLNIMKEQSLQIIEKFTVESVAKDYANQIIKTFAKRENS